jgi:asparagine synthase (glutamine-hydrolysing)
MCGILVAFAKAGPIDVAGCRRALSTTHWRGPDFSYWRVWEDRLFVGQTVLSITGEPASGVGEYHRSRSGRYELLYNGEIYNFDELEARFLRPRLELTPRYGTDTEVLVNLHEVLAPADVPPLLDGMYAYVVFDECARQVHLARDVQGEKSLYVYEDSAWVVIASEIRAIRALVPATPLEPQALRDYFRTRHLMLFDRTVYRGVRQLPPGCLETLDLDSRKWSRARVLGLRDWVEPQRLFDNAHRSVDDLADELDGLLARCVAEMIPKRRYAAVVSGGVDSSLIARHLVSRASPDLIVAVNHVGKDSISADLSGFERTLGRPIETLQVDPAAYAAEIARCQHVCGGPLYSHSFVGQSIQSAFVRASGCRVLFGGEGADELFGGYAAYVGSPSANGRFSPSP